MSDKSIPKMLAEAYPSGTIELFKKNARERRKKKKEQMNKARDKLLEGKGFRRGLDEVINILKKDLEKAKLDRENTIRLMKQHEADKLAYKIDLMIAESMIEYIEKKLEELE
ncbi:MAG: hypothetical protein ACTSXD_08400 [Candidatus Heimdallarchaeaceae archaeon]